MRRCVDVVFALILVLASNLRADEGIPERRLAELKEATVYVSADGGAVATGFFFLMDDESSLLATVFSQPLSKVSVIIRPGTSKEKTLAAEVVGTDADTHVAVLRVTSNDLPRPLALRQRVEPRESMTIYTLGSDIVDPWPATKGASVGKGYISEVRDDPRTREKMIQVGGELNPGHAGGPVVDSDGMLVGIATSVRDKKIVACAPMSALTAIVHGRIDAAAIDVNIESAENGVFGARLDVHAHDPMQRIKKVAVRYVRKDALAQEIGEGTPLPNSERVELQVDHQTGRALVTLKCTEKKAVNYLFQVAYINSVGKTIVQTPVVRSIDFGPGLVAQGKGRVPLTLPGLIAYWSLDEGKGSVAQDASSNKMQGTVHGGKWVEGISGSALQFDNDREYLDYGDSPKLNFKAGDAFTFAGWLKTKAGKGCVLAQRNSNDQGAADIAICIEGGQLNGRVRNDGSVFGMGAFVKGKAINDDKWHHFALTRDNGKTIELFIDGVSQGKASADDAGGSVTTKLRALGADSSTFLSGWPSVQFYGAVDEFCVFNRALSLEEIRKLASVAEQKGSVITPESPNELKGLIAHWKLDEGKGTTAQDSSPNKMTATLHGGKWVEDVKGAALQFYEEGDYLDVGDSPKLNFKAGEAFTYAGWLKTNARQGCILAQRNANDRGAAVIAVCMEHGGKLHARVRQDGGLSGMGAYVEGKNVNDGQWHHFAMTRDPGNAVELFIDGVSQGKASTNDSGGSVTTNVRALGRDNSNFTGASGSQFFGAVDEFYVFNRALSVEEIRKLASVAEPKGSTAMPGTPTEFSGLLGYWKLDEGKGTAARDASSNKMTATLHGGRWVEGVKGTALQFDKEEEYLDYGDSPKLNFKAGAAFTFAGWVKTSASNGPIVSQRDSNDGGAVIDITLSEGKLGALVRSDGKEDGGDARLTGTTVNDGKWHHFALTRDTGTTIELFIDGVSQGTVSGADAGGSITTNLRALGSERYWAKTGFPNRQLIGAVDEFCVFDRALSSKEIRKLAGPLQREAVWRMK